MNHIAPKILQSKQINNRFIKEIINNHTKRKKLKQQQQQQHKNNNNNNNLPNQSVAFELFLTNFKYNSFNYYFLTKIEVLNYHIETIKNQNRIRKNAKYLENPPRSSSTYTTQSILTQLVKQLIQLIPRLCLVVVFILYLLTTSAVQCVDCQQITAATTTTMADKFKTSKASSAAAASNNNDQFVKLFHTQLNNSTENIIKNSSVYFKNNLFYHHNKHLKNVNNGDVSFLTEKYDYSQSSKQSLMPTTRELRTVKKYNNIEEEKLLKLVMSGLKLKSLPDMNKVNISQQEYANKYQEYLRRLHSRTKRQQMRKFSANNLMDFDIRNNNLALWSIVTTDSQIEESKRPKRELPFEFTMTDETRSKISRRHSNHNLDVKTKIKLNFPLNSEIQMLEDEGIEEANVRLMVLYSPELALSKHNTKTNSRCAHNRTTNLNTKQPKKHIVNLKMYQLNKNGKRQWIVGKKLEFNNDNGNADETQSKWLQFDVTKAVRTWLRSNANFSLEVQCDNCRRIGARILIDDSERSTVNSTENRFDELRPVLNIVGRFGTLRHELELNNHHLINTTTNHNTMSHNKGTRSHQKSKCKSKNQRCCRHSMEVVFKNLKGFEFIIQPKVFDAGYCQGRCPPRYNPANHHAMLQSLIWKQDHKLAPRLCCAPSKLVELEVLHVDEKDSQKLKISTWSNMQVIECACT